MNMNSIYEEISSQLFMVEHNYFLPSTEQLKFGQSLFSMESRVMSLSELSFLGVRSQ